jgi:hypothetical protein
VAADTRAVGTRLLVVGLPSIVEVVEHARVQQEFRRFDPERFDTQAPYRMLEGVARVHDIRYASLVPQFQAALRAHGNPDDFYYACDAHYTAAGHEVAARALADVIRPMIAGAGAIR